MEKGDLVYNNTYKEFCIVESDKDNMTKAQSTYELLGKRESVSLELSTVLNRNYVSNKLSDLSL